MPFAPIITTKVTPVGWFPEGWHWGSLVTFGARRSKGWGHIPCSGCLQQWWLLALRQVWDARSAGESSDPEAKGLSHGDEAQMLLPPHAEARARYKAAGPL